MSSPRPVSILRLILWPSLITLVVNVLRLYLQVGGQVGTQSGGAGAPIGIVWLVFVFGGWFGWRLQGQGRGPSRSWPVVWAVIPLVALMATVAIGFRGIDRADLSDAAYESLRGTVAIATGVAIAGAVVSAIVWRRLALAMLAYALLARGTVVVMTYLAKVQGWDTHYTKFGPAGIERDLGETMFAATVAQMGFWVAFSVIGGVLAGAITSRFRASSPPAR